MSPKSANVPARPIRSSFFVVMAGVALAAVAIGFGRTYVMPLARGTFAAPLIIHAHGALALAWVLLFAAQTLLVRSGRVGWHRRIGYVGFPLAMGVALTMLPAGMVQVIRDVNNGAGATGISSIVGVVTSAMLFVVLVAAGVRARRDKEAHARWLLLATLFVIWPAWFRFRHWFPGVPRPDIIFGIVLAFVWIVVAMVRDRVVRGAVHPVLAWAGTGIIIEQSLETLAFDSPAWRVVAQWIYDLMRVVAV